MDSFWPMHLQPHVSCWRVRARAVRTRHRKRLNNSPQQSRFADGAGRCVRVSSKRVFATPSNHPRPVPRHNPTSPQAQIDSHTREISMRDIEPRICGTSRKTKATNSQICSYRTIKGLKRGATYGKRLSYVNIVNSTSDSSFSVTFLTLELRPSGAGMPLCFGTTPG
jgi:hypothetical protein